MRTNALKPFELLKVCSLQNANTINKGVGVTELRHRGKIIRINILKYFIFLIFAYGINLNLNYFTLQGASSMFNICEACETAFLF